MLFGISDPELLVLDEFEDFEYQRTTADVSLVVTKIEFESPSLLILQFLKIRAFIFIVFHAGYCWQVTSSDLRLDQ